MYCCCFSGEDGLYPSHTLLTPLETANARDGPVCVMHYVFKHPLHVYLCTCITFDVLAYAVLRADVTAARKGRFASGRRRRRQRRNYKVAGSRDVAVIKKFLTHYVKRTKTHNSRTVPACLPAPAASARVYNYVDETISLSSYLYIYKPIHMYAWASVSQPGHCRRRGKRRKTRTSSLSYYYDDGVDDIYWTSPTLCRGQLSFAPL